MQTSFWDTDPFSPSSGTDTPPNACEPERKMDGGQVCTCMKETCKCLIHPRGVDEWTASMRDSLARIFQSPVLGQALQDSGADCGPKSCELLTIYDRENYFWKTAQLSLVEDLNKFSETWPSWGSMRNGSCYQRPPLVPRTYALDGGASPDWQTPVADDACNRKDGKWNSRGEPKLSAQVMIPTPTVCGNYNKKGLTKSSGDGLATWAKMFPTPRATDAEKNQRTQEGVEREIARKGGPQDLIQAVRTWPTPTKSDGTGGPGSSGREGGENLRTAVNGQLNPPWVEWLMGWPIGWTDCEPLATDKCQWPQRPLGAT
jgi:hypothetical protein